MSYEIKGISALSDIFGDFVVYRNLAPADPRLPGIQALWRELGWHDYHVPRKTDMEYAQALARILQAARTLDAPQARLERLLYIGDTRLLDGTAFRNLSATAALPGYAFIGRDDLSRPEEITLEGNWFLANRWHALIEFLRFVEKQGFTVDERTVVVIDMDKTCIGARGRNDKVIDAARVEGVHRTIAGLLGERFDEVAFERAYNELNQPPYHPFTADNQDYLAYICLMLGAGLYELGGLVAAVKDGQMSTFAQFIADVNRRRAEIAEPGLRAVHDEIWAAVQAGDPTPFKAFRYNEYLTTACRFGELSGATAAEALAARIVITDEVRRVADTLRARGALLFAVSDKPDEASLPQPAGAAEGWEALHRLRTLVIGETRG